MGQIHGPNLGSPAAIVTNQGELFTTGSKEVFNSTLIGDVRVRDNDVGILQMDAFSRIETANPKGLGDYIFKYDLLPLEWDQIINGSGIVTHLPNESSGKLFVSEVSGDSIIFSSRRYHRYQAGRGGKIVMTCVPGTGKANVTKRWGFFDNNNGLFFEQNGTAFGVVQRSNVTGTPVDTRIEQTNFNKDIVNGSGVSSFNLNLAKANIYEIDFQWLGVGITAFKIVDDGGTGIVMHNFRNANTENSVYMSTANLPVRYEMINTDTTAGSTILKAICSSVVSSGGEEPPEFIFGGGLGSELGVGTTPTHLFTIRPSGTFKGIENRMLVIPKVFGVSAETKQATVTLLLNANVSGTFVEVDSDSGVEISVGSAAFGGGIPIGKFVVGKDNSKDFDLFNLTGPKKIALSLNVSGNSADKLTAIASSSTATSNIIASLTWGEIR